MKVIWSAPPSLIYDQTPHYFQALFSAGAVYFRKRLPEAEVVTEAAGFHGGLSRFCLRHFACSEPAKYLVIWSRPWEAAAAKRLAKQVRLASPETRIIVWGEACLYMPQYFRRAPFDMFAVSGDPELVVADAIERWEAGQEPEHGVEFCRDGQWHSTAPGRILDPEDWAYPDLEALDPHIYSYWRKKRGQKKDDLSFAISRGCPINCARWCPTPMKEGIKDRRRSAEATVEYMETLPEPFGTFQMHSPLFSWNKDWLEKFLSLRRRSGSKTTFKVVDVMNPYADEALVANLAEVGLTNVGFGIETLARSGRTMIPKVDQNLIERVAANFEKYGVSGKSYVQLGLPGQSRDDIIYTLGYLRDLGFKPRPTGSTPFWKLARMTCEELDSLDLECWDRKSYYEPRSGLSYQEFLHIIDDPLGYLRSLEAKGAYSWAA